MLTDIASSSTGSILNHVEAQSLDNCLPGKMAPGSNRQQEDLFGPGGPSP